MAPHRPNRREFLKATGRRVVAGAVAASRGGRRVGGGAGGVQRAVRVPPIETVRIGYVGVGLQGGCARAEPPRRFPAAASPPSATSGPNAPSWATKAITAAGHPAPAVYTRGPRDFERLCETEDLDLVYTATPWEWHVPVMLAAMKNGKHAATEVPAAMTLDDCWAIVEAAEKYRKHCVMMENCNYDRTEMMVVQHGPAGRCSANCCTPRAATCTICGRSSSRIGTKGSGAAPGRTKLNGNPYPTHGLGPIANCLDINRGDRFDYLVSMSGPSRGLQDWARRPLPARRARSARRSYVLGDVNTSLIKTAMGKTIMVQHCTNLPRPYSRIHMVQGTKGLFEGYPNRALHRRPRPATTSGSMRATLLRRVRASAVEGDCRAGARARDTAAWTSSRTTG